MRVFCNLPDRFSPFQQLNGKCPGFLDHSPEIRVKIETYGKQGSDMETDVQEQFRLFEAEKILEEDQMARAADGQELSGTLDNA